MQFHCTPIIPQPTVASFFWAHDLIFRIPEVTAVAHNRNSCLRLRACIGGPIAHPPSSNASFGMDNKEEEEEDLRNRTIINKYAASAQTVTTHMLYVRPCLCCN